MCSAVTHCYRVLCDSGGMNQPINNSRRPELDVAGILSRSERMLRDLEQTNADRSQLPAKSLGWAMMVVGLVLTIAGVVLLVGHETVGGGLRNPAASILIGSAIVVSALYMIVFVRRLSQRVKVLVSALLFCCYMASILINGAMPTLLLPTVAVMFHLFFSAKRALAMSFLSGIVSVGAMLLDGSVSGAVSARVMLSSLVIVLMMQVLTRQVTRSYISSLKVSDQLSSLVTRMDRMLKDSHNELETALQTDPGSGLLNATGFNEALNSRLANAPAGVRHAVLCVKLKGLEVSKSVLDECERKTLLKILSQRFWRIAGSDGIVARSSHSDFLISLRLEDIGDHYDDLRLTGILKNLGQPIQLHKHSIPCNPFIGVSIRPTDGGDGAELRRKAETAAHAALIADAKRVLVYDDSMRETIRERLQILSGIQAAIDADQFELEYQPVFDLGLDRFHKVEALIRWNHPELGRVPPNRFIPLLDSEQLVEITAWVMNTVNAQMKKWHAEYGMRLDVAVNIPAAYLHHSIANQELFFRRLNGFDRNTGNLIFEITESSLFEAGEDALEFLTEVRGRGFHVALDDFGTGFSNLLQLETLPLDILKIDKSLIDEIDASERKMALCGYVIRLGHELGMKVVAEGIESEDQRDALIWAGCDYGQGYLFAKPLPAARIPEFFSDSCRATA